MTNHDPSGSLIQLQEAQLSALFSRMAEKGHPAELITVNPAVLDARDPEKLREIIGDPSETLGEPLLIEMNAAFASGQPLSVGLNGEDGRVCVVNLSPEGTQIGTIAANMTGLDAHKFSIPSDQLPLLLHALNAHETMHCLEGHSEQSVGLVNKPGYEAMRIRQEGTADLAATHEMQEIGTPVALAAQKTLIALRTIGDVERAMRGLSNDHADSFALYESGGDLSDAAIKNHQNGLAGLVGKAQSVMDRMYSDAYGVRNSLSEPHVNESGAAGVVARGHVLHMLAPNLMPAAIQALYDSNKLDGYEKTLAARYLESLRTVAPSVLQETTTNDMKTFLSQDEKSTKTKPSQAGKLSPL